jgi:hypothetical protein
MTENGADNRKEIAMPLPLPKPIEVFMSSENTHDTDALAECFASDATVQDEGQTLKGLKAIKASRLETAKKYQHTLEPVAASARGGKTVVSQEPYRSFHHAALLSGRVVAGTSF